MRPPGPFPKSVGLVGRSGHARSVAWIGAHPGQRLAVGRHGRDGLVHDLAVAAEGFLKAAALVRERDGASADVAGHRDGRAADLGRVGLTLSPTRPVTLLPSIL